MKRRLVLASGLGALILAPARVAARDWPDKAIRWIVPYQPGTAPDMTVRVVAESLAELWRQPVVVENKGGAAGNIGAQTVARAAPDGYTWLYSATTMAINMRMYKAPGYHLFNDFTHVSRIASSDVLLLVHPEAGVSSLAELIERMRRLPGRLNYGSGGVGTPAHFGTELMLHAAGVQAVHVPFKGATESVNAVIGRQIDFTLALLQVGLAHVRSGRLKALAVTGPTRNAQLPQIPTLAESGLPGVQVLSFGGVSLPAGAPEPLVRQINEALHKVLAQASVRSRLEALGAGVSPGTPAQYVSDLRAEVAQTERMMKLARLEPQ